MPDLLDLTPKFRTFFALAEHADPETRWQLWQQHYAFAAVPPTPGGQGIARRLLDAAWEKYAELPTDLRPEVTRLQRQAQEAEQVLEELFETATPDYRLVTYVGGFEGNAFVAGTSLCMPVEMPADWAGRVLTHELTHLFHHELCGSDGGWQRSVAALIVQEGLATRTTAALHPTSPLQDHLGTVDWLRQCEDVRSGLWGDALSRLDASDDAALLRFLLPHPEFAAERTAYALGWWLVGDWLAQGHTLTELARVPEADLPALVAQRTQ